MFRRILEWASITALVLIVGWRPAADHHLALDLVVCAGAVLLALTLLFRREIEIHLAPLAARGPSGRV